MPHADPATRIRSLSRSRNGLLIAAVVVPLALLGVFERQARRLDALAARGLAGEGVVTEVSGGGTFYAYRVGDAEYTWNVARDQAPFAVGEVFPIVYLPDVPSFSRPIADRHAAAEEAARNRGFAWKVAIGVGLTLALLAFRFATVRQARAGALPSPEVDPAAFRRRVRLIALTLVPALVLVSAFHLGDSRARGESVVPAAAGIVVSLAVVGGTLFFMTRGGPAAARDRSRRLLRWVLPIAIGLAILRLVVAIVAG